MSDSRMTYDGPKLSPDEATELCVYHLRVAAGLFQLVPDDNNSSLLNEINRQAEMNYDKVPAIAWADAILKEYDNAKARD